MGSAAQRFKRALVSVLLELARLYGMSLPLTRDSLDNVIKASYRKAAQAMVPAGALLDLLSPRGAPADSPWATQGGPLRQPWCLEAPLSPKIKC